MFMDPLSVFIVDFEQIFVDRLDGKCMTKFRNNQQLGISFVQSYTKKTLFTLLNLLIVNIRPIPQVFMVTENVHVIFYRELPT